ncbi:MAG: TetR family transcriptional regulator [Rhodobacterales bacterium]|nr:TetR family transcriptional regulator [Rhodobacterales bacterium]
MSMVNPSPQTRRRDKTRRRILDISRSLVASGGIDALTLGNVAKALELTTAALYRYFPSKGALLSEVTRGAVQELRAIVARLQVSTRLDPLLSLLAVIESTVLAAQVRRDVFALLSGTVTDPRVLIENPAAAVHIPEMMGLLADIRPMAEAASQSGALQPGAAEERVMVLVFAMLGVLQLEHISRFRPSLAEGHLARSTGTDLLVGWGADRTRLQALQSRAQTLAHSAVLDFQ